MAVASVRKVVAVNLGGCSGGIGVDCVDKGFVVSHANFDSSLVPKDSFTLSGVAGSQSCRTGNSLVAEFRHLMMRALSTV